MQVDNKVSGEFCLVINEGTEAEQSTGWFKNMILDQGLKIFASNNMSTTNGQWAGSRCFIGTSGTAPAANQTSLLSPVAFADIKTYLPSTPSEANGWLIQATISYVFEKGAVVGNMAEVGIGWSTTSMTDPNLFSRTLITDSSGNPTVLTLTSIDQLTVYYKLTVQQDLNVYNGTLSLGGIDYPYTVRRAALNQQAMPLYSNFDYVYRAAFVNSVIAFGMYGTSEGATSAQVVASMDVNRIPGNGTYLYAYQNYAGLNNQGTYGITWTGSTSTDGFSGITTITMGPDWYVGPNAANIKPIKYLVTLHGGSYQWLWIFDTPLPKTDTNTLSLTFTQSWSRA